MDVTRGKPGSTYEGFAIFVRNVLVFFAPPISGGQSIVYQIYFVPVGFFSTDHDVVRFNISVDKQIGM